VIPLVGVPGACEQPHALASVLATEAAIANGIARQLERTDASAAPAGAVGQAVTSAENSIGTALSAEQRQAAESICGSGRGAELLVGVAGAGKTTLLQVVAAAFEAAGCRVFGTATSGQAARTLGREAELGESRTLASLLWRLDHDRVVLDDRSVVILDEMGMTDDAHLVALTARVEAAGAKLVLVGVLSELDLSLVTGYTDGGVSAAVIRLCKAGEVLPIRGYVADMGACPTHKGAIIRLYLEGPNTHVRPPDKVNVNRPLYQMRPRR
jgi:hypothetical protein